MARPNDPEDQAPESADQAPGSPAGKAPESPAGKAREFAAGKAPGGPAEPHASPEEALRRLEKRLDQASDAAERLMAQAASAAARSGARPKPPPSGWQLPENDSGAAAPPRDFELLVQFAQSLRDMIPAELQQRLIDALREVLLAIRALIDWYLERLEHRKAERAEVQDIPIL